VLAHKRQAGLSLARVTAVPWLVVVLSTVAFVWLVYRPRESIRAAGGLHPFRPGAGAAATAAATAAILALHNPAVPVLAIGMLVAARRRLRPDIDLRVLLGLFVLAVGLGTLAREWSGPASLVRHASGVAAAAIAAGATVLVNNLPAAALLSAQRLPHPLPILFGLDRGPNLLFTGSLSTYLWYRAARRAGTRPSLREAAVLGWILVPLTLAAALAALRYLGSASSL